MDAYELQFNFPSTAGPIVVTTLVASATVSAVVLEFGLTTIAIGVSGDVVFGRPSVLGVGTAGAALQPLDPSDTPAATTSVNGAWATTQPAPPTVPLRRFAGGSTASGGTGVIWGWDPGELIIPAGGQLGLWIVSGTFSFRGYAKVAEGG